jgi:Zn-dependent protease
MALIKKRSGLIWILNKICSILPAFFWLFLIFGFDEPSMAITTIVGALIHETGHIGYIILKKKLKPSIKGVISGFRIKAGTTLSYEEEIGVYLAGPISNLIAFVIFSFAALSLGEHFWVAAIINLATALSNLLPIEGYDGYGVLAAIINKHELGEVTMRHLSHLSSGLIFLFCILSLYFIDRQGGGYWIFMIFFISMVKCINKAIGE